MDVQTEDIQQQVLLRPGTCERPAPGRAYHGSPSWSFDPPAEPDATWAVEIYDKHGGLRVACGDHHGARDLETPLTPSTASQGETVLEALRVVVPLSLGTVTITADAGGTKTVLALKHESLADYMDHIAHVREGRCGSNASAAEIPLAPLIPDDEAHEDTGVSEWATSETTIDVAFATFVKGPYAVEVHDRDTSEFGGYGIESCAEIPPH